MKHGVAFPEHIKTSNKHRHHSVASEHSFRGYVLLAFLFLSILILFFKLVSLQVVQGPYYRQLSDSNRIKTKIVHAPRGIIFDREGVPLVYNIPGFRKTQAEKSILLSKDAALEELAKGTDLEIATLRQYPLKDAGAHVLGYIGQISEGDLKRDEYQTYRSNDWIGKSGIEKQYERQLVGFDGKELVEINAVGKKVRTLGQTDPVAGQNITLTLSSKLQKAVYKALSGTKKGVVIVSTPQGEALAMISKPSFDPNIFTLDDTYKPTDTTYKNVEAILADSGNQPLVNRAVAGSYPPGSTFKIITAAAGLEDDLIDEKYKVEDTGIIRIGTFSFANWYFTQYGRKDGDVNVVKGISRSNDIFFYKVAELVGVDRLSAMAKKFHLGSVLGIDLEGEQGGVVPTEEWKKRVIGESWYLGDTYHYGIGQGYLLTTPLQINSWTQVIANGGSFYKPHLLKSEKLKVKNEKFLSEKTVSLIREGMVMSCSSGGVAWPLFKFKVKNEKLKVDGKNFLTPSDATMSAKLNDYREIVVACKTGTAQHGGEETLPHAWITLFAPAYEPQIVVTVLVESSGEGSNIAAPIAKKVLETWFQK